MNSERESGAPVSPEPAAPPQRVTNTADQRTSKWLAVDSAWSDPVPVGVVDTPPPTDAPKNADPVQVHEMWQATCDACGWHTAPSSPHAVVREWARLHRVTCPLKSGVHRG